MTVQDEVKRSRITLTYKTNIEGEPAVVDLPLRLMVLANLSGGSSKDRDNDLDTRSLRRLEGSNLNEVIKDMGINLEMVIPNKINPTEESIRVKLDIGSIKDFTPEEIAKKVPQIRSLVLLKKLLEEIQSNVANKKEFSRLLAKLYSSPEALGKLKEKLEKFANHKIPNSETKNIPLDGGNV